MPSKAAQTLKQLDKKTITLLASIAALAYATYYAQQINNVYILTALLISTNAAIIYTSNHISKKTKTKRRTLYTASVMLACFSYTAISLSLIFLVITTPALAQDPYTTTKRLLQQSYYQGTSTQNEQPLTFNQSQTISIEQLTANTTINQDQVTIQCPTHPNLRCTHGAVHAWNQTTANLQINCLTLPCTIKYYPVQEQ